MEITAFEWDEWNEEKVYRHGVSPDEAEQCFYNLPQWHKRKRGMANRQERYYLLGSADSGRLLFVVYQRKQGGIVRVITAYDKK